MKSCEQFAPSCEKSCPIWYPQLVRERQATGMEVGLGAIGLMEIALHFYRRDQQDAATDSLFRSIELHRAVLADAQNHTVAKARQVLEFAFPDLPAQAWEILDEGGLDQKLEEAIQYHTAGAVPAVCTGRTELAPEDSAPVVLCGAQMAAASVSA